MDNPEPVIFRGSIKAGHFTAQIGVHLSATREALILSASGRKFQIDRDHFDGFEDTSLLGIFKRGVRIRHHQDQLPDNIVFYPRIGQQALRTELNLLGWA